MFFVIIYITISRIHVFLSVSNSLFHLSFRLLHLCSKLLRSWERVLQRSYFSLSKYELKSSSHLPKKNCFIYFIESPLKIMKNVFCSISKTFFVFQEILVFVLSFWSKFISKFMTSQSG